jgi:hypothetical protein
MSSRSRKLRILQEATVSESPASEIAEALHRCADELAGIGGALAYIAAAEHSDNAGRQRELGGVIYRTATLRFGGVKYDGEPIDRMTIENCDKALRKLLRGL